jgi:hypothetical protein
MATFFHRLAGAAMLDSATYEDVEADSGATVQALAVVVLSSLAAGIGLMGMQDDAPVTFFVGTTLLSLMAWMTWALVMYAIGSRILPTRDTRTDVGELLRTLGFAATPGLLQVFGAAPGGRQGIFLISILWSLAASVVAVRQALDFKSTGRAIAVCALGWILSITIAIVMGLAFGPRLRGSFTDVLESVSLTKGPSMLSAYLAALSGAALALTGLFSWIYVVRHLDEDTPHAPGASHSQAA